MDRYSFQGFTVIDQKGDWVLYKDAEKENQELRKRIMIINNLANRFFDDDSLQYDAAVDILGDIIRICKGKDE